jgi:hypothetical protein
MVLTVGFHYFSSWYTVYQDTERIIGCSGSPADSHDVIWFNLTEERQRRCPECGSGPWITYIFVEMTILTSDYFDSLRP